MSEPIFVDLSDSKPTEIESLCMKCQENVSELLTLKTYTILTCQMTGYYPYFAFQDPSLQVSMSGSNNVSSD